MQLVALSVVMLAACGGAQPAKPATTGQTAIAEETPPTVEARTESTPAAEEAEAEGGESVAAQTSPPACRSFVSTASTPADLATVSRVRAVIDRVGPRPNQMAFSDDGTHLLYVHPGQGERGATTACGGRFLGSALVAVNVRTRRCKLVHAGGYVDGATPIPITSGADIITHVSPQAALALGVASTLNRPPAPELLCIEIDGEAQPDAARGARTRSDRHLAFVRPDANDQNAREILVADLTSGNVRTVGRVDDATSVTIHPLGEEERFLVAVRSGTRRNAGFFDLDAVSGSFRRLGHSEPELGAVTVSPDGRFAAYARGTIPGPPPRPQDEQVDLRTQGIDPRSRPGCDPVGYPPGGCGWATDGCGGYTYLGDCPELIRARAQALRRSALQLIRIPSR
jgi:hypothetical protein